jgi:hypothetical protein
MVLNILLETGNGYEVNKTEFERVLFDQVLMTDKEVYASLKEQNDLNNMIKFKMNLTLLPQGAFARYSAQRKAEGADIAHLKPPHINPSQKVLTSLLETMSTPAEITLKVPAKQNNVPVS